MVAKKMTCWLWVCGVMMLAGFLYADIPQMMNYQGVIAVDGVRFTGTGYFKFAIVNAAGDVSYWSNDGTSTGGSEPTSAVSLSVSEGRFSVQLGDTSIPNMTQEIPANVFSSAERYLRVWFADGVHGSQLLSPDSRLKSSPYSYIADDAQQLDGQDSTDFAPAVHPHSSLSAADGSPADAVYVDNDGNVGIGTTIPAEQLEVAGNSTVTGDISVSGNSIIGSSTSAVETLDNAGFTLDGDDLFVAGTAGIEGTIYTDSGMTVGASTNYADGAIDTSGASPFSIGATNATAVTIGRNGQQANFPGDVNLGNASADTITFHGTSAFNTSVTVTNSGSETVIIDKSVSSATGSVANALNIDHAGGSAISDAIEIDMDRAAGQTSDNGIRIDLSSGGAVDLNSGILINNAAASAGMSNGIQVTSSAGGITTGLDASDAQITNAINIGANNIAGTNFSVDGSTGNTTVGGTLGVTGTSDFAGNMTVNGSARVGGFFNLTQESQTSLVAGATLTPGTSYVQVGSYAAITLDTTTAITDGNIGQILVLEGTDNTNTVTVPDWANCELSADRTLGQGDTLMLLWNGSDWIELSFANN